MGVGAGVGGEVGGGGWQEGGGTRARGGEGERVAAEYAGRGKVDEAGRDQDDVYTANLRFRSGEIGNLSTCSILHRRFNAGLELHERAGVGQAYDLSAHHRADREALHHVRPRVSAQLLQHGRDQLGRRH